MNTPLTDAAAFDRDEDCSVPDNEVVSAEFARYLEIQPNAEKSAVAYWTQKWNEQTASRDRAMEELAYVKLQRDKLLEITWLDTPDDPHESTKRWAEEFAKGWIRRYVPEVSSPEVMARAESLLHALSGLTPDQCIRHIASALAANSEVEALRTALTKITKLRWGNDGDCGAVAIAEEALL